jgi:hypothetical protein
MELPNYHAVARLVTDAKMSRAFSFQPAGNHFKYDPERAASVRNVFADKSRLEAASRPVDTAECPEPCTIQQIRAMSAEE